MTACLSADLYALRVALQNARECTAANGVVRLAIGWNQAAAWIVALEGACEQLDQAADEGSEPRIYPRDLTREEWIELLHDGDERRTTGQIAAELGCNRATVIRQLERHGLPAKLTVWREERNNGHKVTIDEPAAPGDAGRHDGAGVGAGGEHPGRALAGR